MARRGIENQTGLHAGPIASGGSTGNEIMEAAAYAPTSARTVAPHSAPCSAPYSAIAALTRTRALDERREPEAQPSAQDLQDALLRVLDEVDHGLVLTRRGGAVVFANHAARCACREPSPLSLAQGHLGARRARHQDALAHSLADAARGTRAMVVLNDSECSITLGLVPLCPADTGAEHDLVLAVFGRQQVCESLSFEFFARTHQLTGAESRVLRLLCDGLRPAQAAQRLGVAASTVRTQINSARAKTGATSIRDLVKRMGSMPQMVPALRAVASAGTPSLLS
jgi:DNA-binding CsgD family transcriptional regulator